VSDQQQQPNVYALFSGGHDSLATAHIASRERAFAGCIHINTGTGIPDTTSFVRETCQRYEWPLIELSPAVGTYERLVLERGGFPYGESSHNSMLFYLKQQPLARWFATTIGTSLFYTGIRRDESVRRMGAGISTPERRDGRKTWVSPILDWTALDVSRYIDARGLARNPVVDVLHRSGECLCGALARQDEIHEIDRWFPEVGARIHALERRCEGAGITACVWAGKEARRINRRQLHLFPKSAVLPLLCSSCEAGAVRG
jgi:3'-phosphoadenosine 5'-phosphosulfate sulfotransferase (PAPS reductase)/FAD synthetase